MLEKLIQYGLVKNMAFAFWRYPGKDIKGIFSDEALPVEKNGFPEKKGFFIAPFSDEENGFLIPGDLNYAQIQSLGQLGHFKKHPDKGSAFPDITDKGGYFQAFRKIKSGIDRNLTKKVVLSRTRETKEIHRGNAGSMFLALEKAYPSAMAYVFNVPQKGAWMGATPEILLSRQGDFYETVAVAGTRSAKSKENWTEKEIHEQELVSEFIEDVLSKNGVRDYHREGPGDYRAGNVIHLKTTFRIPAGSQGWNPFRLASDLHPTPAVCGIPRETAKSLIRETEKHDRDFYSGFLGEVDFGKQEVNLFVNLRCLQVFNNRSVLYAGGGLTKGSEVEKEWEETQEKTRTILNVAEKLK